MNHESDKKFKHLTEEDRQTISDLLALGQDFKTIGKAIGKDQTTVSKEVKKHTFVREKPPIYRENGTKIDIPACPKLMRPPYVCNSCERKSAFCKYEKHIYIPNKAQQAYKETLSESRTGIALNKQNFWVMDHIISEKIQQGQHMYQIVQSNDLGTSLSSAYRYMNKGYLSASRIDLPRAVKFKPRKKEKSPYVPKACKTGRTYMDFCCYIEENEISSWVEMDTVIGREGGKVILTLHFTICNFMLGFLLENKTSDSVSMKFQELKQIFSNAGIPFTKYFPLILTDNGGEFANTAAIENSLENKKETELFFCDPMCSWQKPQIEKNHTLFRDIVPKGATFDTFSQDTVNTIFSHVNSVKRKKLNGKTPFEIFAAFFGTELPDLLGILEIPPDEVVQSPKLLK